MKAPLIIAALLFSLFSFSQDTPVNPTYQKRVQAAMDAQNPPVSIKTDSLKKWKQLITVQNRSEWTWWDYTKEFTRQMWKDKPYIVVLLSIFLLVGIWRLIKLIFKIK